MLRTIKPHLSILLLFAFLFIAKSVKAAPQGLLNGIYKVENNETPSAQQIDYIYFNNGLTVYFLKDKISYVLKNTKGENKISGQRIDVIHQGNLNSYSKQLQYSAEKASKISMSLNGELSRLIKVDTVTFPEIYKNIALKYFLSENGELTYHYYLNKNANPSDISVKYEGADGLRISENGNLIIENKVGELNESSPITFKNKLKEVKSSYTLLKDNSISYSIKNFSAQESYIIDPIIRYGTYLGGADAEDGEDLAVDDSSNVYGVGTSLSNDFPTSTGAFQMNRDASEDVVIFKMDSLGRLKWATYYGGNEEDAGTAIAISSSGNVFVTGHTESLTLPGTNNLYPGSKSAFVAIFDRNGVFKNATYLGGNSNDEGRALMVIGDTAYVTGFTNSVNFPLAGIGLATIKNPGADVFLTAVNDTAGIIWSQYYGGSSEDFGRTISKDAQNNILIGGETESTDLPILLGSQAIKGGADDGFIARFNTLGLRTYSTYYGGNGLDRIRGIETDADNNFYVVGSTQSTDLSFPVTGISYQPANAGGLFDLFLIKFNENGIPQWGTYYGDTASDQGTAIAVSASASIILTGQTESINFPIDSSTALQLSKSVEFDAFIVQFDSVGNRTYASFLGGNGNDDGKQVVFEPNQSNYVVYGNTRSTDFPVTSSAHQINNEGGSDIFIYTNCSLIPNNRISVSGSDTLLYCSNGPLLQINGTTPLGGSGNYTFEFQQAIGNGPFVTVPNSNVEDLTIDTAELELGFNTFRRIVSDGFCIDTSEIAVINYLAAPLVDFSFDTLCVGNDIQFTDETTLEGNIDSLISWNWSFDDGTTSTERNPIKTFNTIGTYNITLNVTASNGCSDDENKNLTINDAPTADFTFVSECGNDTVRFTNTSTNVTINEYRWDFGDGNTSTNENPFNVYDNFNGYNVTLIVGSPLGCADTITKNVAIDSAITADFGTTNNRCVDSTVTFNDLSSSFSPITNWNWDFGNGTSSTQSSPTVTYTASGDFTVKLIVSNATGCIDSITKVVSIGIPPVADFTFTGNCINQSTQFTDASTSSSGIVNGWLYSFGDGNSSSNQNPTNTYTSATPFTATLTATTEEGCSDIISKTVTVNNKPVVVAGEDKIILEGQSVQISSTTVSPNIISYSWLPTNSLNSSTIADPTANPTETTLYTVRITDGNNCFGEDSLTVFVLPEFFIPTAFTPNGDGENDQFEIEGIDRFPNHSVDIFNRWGSSIYSTEGNYFASPWDGKYDGEEMPMGTYYYIIDLGDGSELLKGTITILR